MVVSDKKHEGGVNLHVSNSHTKLLIFEHPLKRNNFL